jgi:hypothetical protein
LLRFAIDPGLSPSASGEALAGQFPFLWTKQMIQGTADDLVCTTQRCVLSDRTPNDRGQQGERYNFGNDAQTLEDRLQTFRCS